MAPPVIKCWEKAPPLGALALANLTGFDTKLDASPKYPSRNPPVLSFDNGYVSDWLTLSSAARRGPPPLPEPIPSSAPFIY